MKKAAIYSFFESHNIGDVLIAEQIKKIFSPYLSCEFFDISSGKPSEQCALKQFSTKNEAKKSSLKSKILNIPFLRDVITSFLFFRSKGYLDIVSAGRDCEVAIFAGGNIIMELNRFPTGSLTLYRTVKKLKKENKKVCFCFCGVGPFASVFGRRIAKKIISSADFISVRDSYSLSCVKRLVPDKSVEIWPDPVLSFTPESVGEGDRNGIGVNVYFGCNEALKTPMKEAYVKCVAQLREKYGEKPVYLFSSELTDINDIYEVSESFSDDSLVRVEKISSREELFDLYSRVEVVLGARMHTVITATVSKIPVASIAWQGKVAAVMKLLEASHFNISAEEFIETPEKAIASVERCFDEKESYVNKTQNMISQIKNNANKKLEDFVSLLED
ncbi:MAG: polysaccharide pyruvyl transferase family protein [Clostridia bacterium]|nr:polysaccharide pyruvyl transferase family protein [Clostridia bacterium]